MLEVETDLHHKHRWGGGLCLLGRVKPPCEQSPWKSPSSSPSPVSAEPGPVHVQGRSVRGARRRCREGHVLGLACRAAHATVLFTPTTSLQPLAKAPSPVWEDLACGETLARRRVGNVKELSMCEQLPSLPVHSRGFSIVWAQRRLCATSSAWAALSAACGWAAVPGEPVLLPLLQG